MVNIALAYRLIDELLSKTSIKYEAHAFPSEAIILDIWHQDKFYVLQFEYGLLGLSEITDDNPGFDTILDEKFYDIDAFVERVASLVSKA